MTMIGGATETLDSGEEHYSGFACRCGESGKAECTAVEGWVREHLGMKDDHWLLTRVVNELAGAYGVYVQGVPTDPGGWSAVTTESGRPELWSDGITWSSFIQCDRIEDGFFWTLRAAYERFGERRTWKEDD